MANVIKLSELIGVTPTVHEYELNGRTILYESPTVKSLPAMRQMFAENLTLSTITAASKTVLSEARFKDGEFDEAWWAELPLAWYMHFIQFMRNPENPPETPKEAEPFAIEVRDTVVTLPPIKLGDIAAFSAFIEGSEEFSDVDYLLMQIDRILGNAKLEDGSPAPEGIFHSLTSTEVQALISFWINRTERETKNAAETPKTGSSKKTSTGASKSRSSRKRSDTASSQSTPTTSET